MEIRIIDHSGFPYIDHPGFGPWHSFEEQLKSRGNVIIRQSFEVKAEINIINCYSSEIIRKIKLSEMKAINILIIWEPSVTNSKLYSSKYLENFNMIYCASKIWAERINSKSFNWPAIPVNKTQVVPDQWLTRQKKAVMVLSNKFSSHKNELYSLRRKLASSASDKTLSVFGMGWRNNRTVNLVKWIKSLNRSGLRNLKISSLYPIKIKKWNRFASIDNKYETLAGFRISVVIENSNDYISEKLFDSLYSQNIVIYVGPNLREFNLSEDLVIPSSSDLDVLNKIITEIISLDDERQLEILEKQQKVYLEECANWNNELVMSQLANQILEDLKLL